MSDPLRADSQFKSIYETTGMSPVRMLNIVAVAFCVAGIGMAYWLYSAPPQQSISGTSTLLWSLALLVLALAAPIVAWHHGRHLAARLLISADGKTLRVVEPNLIGTSERDVLLSDITLTGIEPGDASGEKEFSPGRLEVAVRAGRHFTVTFDRGKQQRDAVLAALRGR